MKDYKIIVTRQRKKSESQAPRFLMAASCILALMLSSMTSVWNPPKQLGFKKRIHIWLTLVKMRIFAKKKQPLHNMLSL